MLDVIKEYLVGLGFSTDLGSFNQAKGKLDEMNKSVTSFATTTVKQLSTASAAYASFIVAANVGIAKFISGMAKADLENEKFARKMWMNKEAAVAYKDSLSALGANIEDLYLSPELMQRYQQLRQQAGQMNAPAEYGNQMKQIRDITFEFQRMKLEATAAMRWIAYYLFKYLEKPINNLKKSLKTLNDNITKTMPQWTQKVAQVLSWFVRLGEAAIFGFGKVKDLLDSLSPATKTAGAAIAGFLGLLSMGPIGWLIVGLTTLLLLLDDYKTYQEGGKSLFGDSWEKLDQFMNKLNNNGILKDFQTSLNGISESIGKIFGRAKELGDKVLTFLGFKDFTDFLNQVGIKAFEELENALAGIAGALKTIDGILSGDTDKIKEGLEDIFDSVYDSTITETSDQSMTSAIANALQGNKKESRDKTLDTIFGKISETLFPGLKQIKLITQLIEPVKNLIDSLFPHADGGIFTTPHIGLVAEGGYGETIIPHDPSKRQNALNLLGQTAGILGAPMSNTSNTSTVNYYNFNNTPNYNIYGTEPNATARSIDRNNTSWNVLTRNFRGAVN